jgi:PAS domain S-box-containing protein
MQRPLEETVGSWKPGPLGKMSIEPRKPGSDSLISLLSAIIESSDDAIVSKTLGGIITSWNGAAERMFGYTAAEAIGQHITLIIPAERHAEEEHVLACIRRGEKVRHFETVRRAKDGRLLNILLSVSPVKDAQGRIVGASKLAREITDSKRMERERDELLVREQVALQEVQRANRLLNEQVELLREEVLARQKAEAELAEALDARDEFIAVAAHELRNPLNVSVLTLQVLHRASSEPSRFPQIRGLSEKLGGQLRRLSTLIDRLFDVTQIRTDAFELYRESFDICDLIKQVTARFAVMHSDITISFDLRTSIEGTWDRIRIDQALTNLISNATKYGGERPITVSASVVGHEAVVRIEDQGIGISREVLERIFDRFERGAHESRKESRGSRKESLGLGLWITKKIVDAHGGTIVAESELGKGSVFTMRLPL